MLGLDQNWSVRNVNLDIANKEVRIYLDYIAQNAECPECRASCPKYDHAPERVWRHLDTMQFSTFIHAPAPFITAVKKTLVHADIVFDKFHIVQHLSKAVDKVRRTEHAQLQKRQDHRLKHTKYLWLKGFENLSEESQAHLQNLLRESLNVGQAWHVNYPIKCSYPVTIEQ